MNEKSFRRPPASASSPATEKVARVGGMCKVELVLIDGERYDLEFPDEVTAGALVSHLATRYNLDGARWRLALRADGRTEYYFREDEVIAEHTMGTADAYLVFYPEVAAGWHDTDDPLGSHLCR